MTKYVIKVTCTGFMNSETGKKNYRIRYYKSSFGLSPTLLHEDVYEGCGLREKCISRRNKHDDEFIYSVKSKAIMLAELYEAYDGFVYFWEKNDDIKSSTVIRRTEYNKIYMRERRQKIEQERNTKIHSKKN